MADQANNATSRIGDKAKDQASRMQEQSKGIVDRIRQHSPTSQQLIGLVTILVGGVTLAALGGCMILATVVTVLVGGPILLLLSPILVPLAILATLAIGGILAVLSFCVACVFLASWVYKYARGGHPLGAQQIEAARHRLMDTATQMTEKAREYGSNVTGYLQQKAQDVAPGA